MRGLQLHLTNAVKVRVVNSGHGKWKLYLELYIDIFYSLYIIS